MKTKITFILTCIIFCAGCSSVPVSPERKTVFFPYPPEEPRLQYLTSFSSSFDVEGGAGGFEKFILGGEATKKPIVKPYGLRFHQGKIYVCDTVYNSLEILDLHRKKFEYFRPKGAGRLIDPINLDFSPDGKMYVADGRGDVAVGRFFF